jgi:hypothetical protein
MSRISQSIAASLATRDRRGTAAGSEDTVRVRPGTVPRPAPAPITVAERQSGPTAAPNRPAAQTTLSTLAQSAPTAPWAQPLPPATPAWGQPEARAAEPADVTPPEPAVTEPAPAQPAETLGGLGRLRRFWERTSTPAPAPAPAPEPAAPAPAAVDLPPTQLMPVPTDFQTPINRTAPVPVPTGHLGTVPRTQVPLPVPAEPATIAVAPAPAAGRSATPTSIRPSGKSRQTRKARLRVARVDPWSVMKTTLLFGVAGWIMLVVSVFVVFYVIDQTGLYEAVNKAVGSLFSSEDAPFDITLYVNTQRAVGVAVLVGVLDVVIITALATIFAALYNLAANIMGGVEITLAED